MIVAKQMDVRDNIKSFFDIAFSGESVFVPRKENKNVYIISQAEYEELQRAKHNAEYLEKLDRSYAEIEAGDVTVKSIEELRAMQD